MITDAHWKRIGGFRRHHGICVPLFSFHTKDTPRGDFYTLFLLIDWCKKVGFDCIQLLPLNDSGNDPSPYNPMNACSLDPVYIHVPDLKLSRDLSRQEIKELKRNRSQEEAIQQLKEVKEYAEKQGVLLIGDIPILVSPESVDVKEHPTLFDQSLVAGAPPDPYCQTGQKWGFPLFNWEAMERAGYPWWRKRLRFAEQFFHLYRIDHVVGFFRIWAIPKDAPATDGHFLPGDYRQWEAHGKKILEMMIGATSMLPMAEDLGTIPDFVPCVLKELGICGTKVMRWQNIPPSRYEPLSLTTVSTADMEPLQVWKPDLTIAERREILTSSHHSASLFHINLLQEYLALFPDLVSSDSQKERINIPGTVNSTNWNYRFTPSLEEIMEHRELAKEIQRMVE